jgi:hypothetical protein
MKPDGIYLTKEKVLRFKFHNKHGWNINVVSDWYDLNERLAKGGGWIWRASSHEDTTKSTVVPGELWSW